MIWNDFYGPFPFFFMCKGDVLPVWREEQHWKQMEKESKILKRISTRKADCASQPYSKNYQMRRTTEKYEPNWIILIRKTEW